MLMRYTDQSVKPNKMPDKSVLRWNTCCKVSENTQRATFHWLHKGLTCVPLMGHTWAATNGAHLSMQQFSTWSPWVLPLKVPIWNPHETHVFTIRIAHIGPMCNYLLCGQCGLPLMGPTRVCNNFPHGAHVFCLSKYPPTWEPHGTHVCVPPVLHMLGPCLIFMWGAKVSCH